MTRFVWLGAFCVALTAGCSDEYAGRMAVSGKVTLEDQPLSDGMILFEPLDEQGTTSSAAIMDGEYQVDREAGLKPGKYRVRITAGDGTTPANVDVEDPAFDPTDPAASTNIVSVDRIPPEYNERSKQEIEVTADGPNEFDFAIPKAREIRKRRR